MFGVAYDTLTPEQQKSVRSALMTDVGAKGVNRKRLIAAQRLREKADALEAAARGEASA